MSSTDAPPSGGFAGAARVRQLLDAVTAIGSDLELVPMLRRIVATAVELVDARYGALGVLDAERVALAEFITVGVDDEVRAAIGDPPKGHGILGVLITDPRPLRLPDLRRHPAELRGAAEPPRDAFVPRRASHGAGRGVREPLPHRQARRPRSSPTSTRSSPSGSAAAAGVAIENARLHARVREVALLADRERIAMDLHDTVIQQLFATGLSLQAVDAA